MRLLHVIFWEFIQNLFLVLGFLVGLRLGGQDKWTWAGVCMLASSVTGSLAIRFTESKIVPGHREPFRVVLANVATMTGVMLVLAIYLSTGWSNWRTDLALGALVGILLGGVQDLAAGEPLGVRHCLALAGAFGPTLIGIRLLADNLSVLVSVPILTAIVTLIIVLFDYIDYGGLWSTVEQNGGIG